MKIKLSDLWTWDGDIGRGPYLFWGILLSAIKWNIDRIVAIAIFKKTWAILTYINPTAIVDLNLHSKETSLFYTIMFLISIPFLYTGFVLTLRRVRSIGLPHWLSLMFFFPILNLLFFVLMGILPSATVTVAPHHDGSLKYHASRIIPKGLFVSAVFGIGITTVLALLFTLLSVTLFKTYGVGLFVGLPFLIGIIPVLLYSYHEKRSFISCIAVAGLASLIVALGLLAAAMEGVICILMAAPIILFGALVGAIIGYAIQAHYHKGPDDPSKPPSNPSPFIILGLVISLPLLMGAEAKLVTTPPLHAVRTSIVIDAPPEAVWQNVVTFSRLPQTENTLFKAGVAYPLYASIEGEGVGAVRHCVFSTGPFVEPITVWDEPRRLKFDVVKQPPILREMSPYNIAPPHVDKYLQSKGGQFLLTPMANGQTHLEGTTWYEHRIWPSFYWKPWSDGIIHRIHLRVLNHIKTQTEAS